MNYFKRIVEQFTTHDVSASGKRAFYQWLSNEKHAPEKEQALKELWRNIPAKVSPDTWYSLESLKEKTGMSAKRITTGRTLRIWKTAAAVLLIATLSSLYLYLSKESGSSSDLVEQYVAVAETEYVILPDGSEVQINSKTILLYPKSFDGDNRSVYLMGEANFKVTPDAKKPFIVKSSDFQVTVLGTEFNIFAYPEDPIARATVISGSVKVAYNNLQSETILTPNQQLAYNKNNRRHTLESPNMQDVTAWQRGELVFEGTTLHEIIGVMERKYPYTFRYSLNNLKNDKYTFRFRNNASLTEVMDIIVRVVGNLQYSIENDTCVIY